MKIFHMSQVTTTQGLVLIGFLLLYFKKKTLVEIK